MADLGPKQPVTFQYQFTFSSGELKVFSIQLDPATLRILQPPRSSYPDWTRLGHHQCANCPLAESEHPRCPAAASLVEVIEQFGKSLSIEEVEVRIQVEERQYLKRCSLQEAVSSLIGIYMVTSGCPVMAKLRPMVRFHLPFSTLEETRYRAISMYLLAQYFLARRGQDPDWTLTRFVKLYEEILTVNSAFAKRLATARVEDASLNAIVRLDAVASSIAFTVDQQILDELEQLFQAYLGGPAGA
jgi:hypothetical protein